MQLIEHSGSESFLKFNGTLIKELHV
jgi:hypothetical protein